MDKNSTTDSNISLDSLESNIPRRSSIKGNSDENVDTILVPFYEKDVLIKVPKDKKRKQNNSGNKYHINENQKKELFQSTGYLVNKDRERKPKHKSYLEMFRKQFAPNHLEQKKEDRDEIRSISPEFGDTERESIGEDANGPLPEFYNTEPYNEIYYEQLICRDIKRYLDNSFEEDHEELHLEFTERLTNKPVEIRDPSPENLRSVSEVRNTRRHIRRATVEPIQTVRLGGLGPDMEQIKPRLERARSLQRYSEKVRMENRLKIYKKTCQTQIDKKSERDTSSKRSREPEKEPSNKECQEKERPSYLVNKSTKEKTSTVYNPYIKSKSADVQKIREKTAEKEQRQKQSVLQRKDNVNQKTEPKQKVETKPDVKSQSKKSKERTKSSSQNKGINTEMESEVPPVQISFMVNVGGVRQTSALKTLEEKHKMYQEQVKAFMENNNNS